MSDRLFEGRDDILALVFCDETYFKIGDAVGTEKIVVTMESGQMAGVPWFEIWQSGKLAHLVNGAIIQSIIFKST